MRKFIILAAVAPLAVLAACGDNEAEDVDVETSMAADTLPVEPATTGTDGPATSLADAGDYSGVYTTTGEDGAERAVRIDASDNSYQYVGPDTELRSGTYTTTPDGYRLQITDYFGEPAWFTISNGELVKLQGDVEMDNTMTVTGERYARAEEGDAVFSRFPELGSPVAPDVSQD